MNFIWMIGLAVFGKELTHSTLIKQATVMVWPLMQYAASPDNIVPRLGPLEAPYVDKANSVYVHIFNYWF